MDYKEAYEKAKNTGAVKPITPDYVEFAKKGDVQIGRLRGSSDVQGSIGEGTYKQYLVDTDKGLVKFALGSATDREIAPLLIVGNIYVFEFQGKEKLTGGRTVNKFAISHIPEEDGQRVGSEDDIPF